jgi:diacylglycerol kinase
MKFIRSLDYAWQGVRHCFKTQLNFRIQFALLLIAITAGFILEISITEWLIIIVSSALVLILELINTAIEILCNMVSKEIHPSIKIIKDASAAAVLIGATASAATGIIIFFPKIVGLFK